MLGTIPACTMWLKSAIKSGVPLFACIFLGALAVGLAACAKSTNNGMVRETTGAVSTKSAENPASPVPADARNVPGVQDYLIGPGDLLKIEVFRVEALTREVRVNAGGQIALPLIGLVRAAGRTSDQLAADIAARLSKDFLQNPQVVVFIMEYTSQRVTVVGEVNSPGVYPIKGRVTLLQAVATAGGPTKVANIGTVKVLRAEPNGTRKTMEYSIADIRSGLAVDPEMRGEDVVQVDANLAKSSIKQLFEYVLPFVVIGSFL